MNGLLQPDFVLYLIWFGCYVKVKVEKRLSTTLVKVTVTVLDTYGVIVNKGQGHRDVALGFKCMALC